MISGPETNLVEHALDGLINLGTQHLLQKRHMVPCCAACALICLTLLATLIPHLPGTQSNHDSVFSTSVIIKSGGTTNAIVCILGPSQQVRRWMLL